MRLLGLAGQAVLLAGAPFPVLGAGRGLTRRTWTSSDGLPANAIQAICPTRDGYLWVATEEGLARFDGKEFVVFRSGSEPAFEDDNVRALAETTDGFLWIGMWRAGLVRHRTGRFERIGARSGLGSKKIMTLYVGTRGVLWVGTAEGKVFWRDREAFHELGGLPAEARVLAMAETPDGSLWVGTRDHGLFRAGRSPDRRLTGVAGLPAGPVTSFGSDDSGQLWAGIEGGGVCVAPRPGGGCEKVLVKQDGLPSEAVRAILRDSKGRLWIGTRGGSLAVAGSGTIRGAGDLTSGIWCLAEGPPGTIWIGTMGGGLSSLHEGTITALTERDGIAPGPAYTVCESADGSAWIGSNDRKLSRFRNGVAAVQSLGDPKGTLVSVVWPRRRGGVWAGTFGDGVYSVDARGGVTEHLSRGDLSADVVRALVEDASGTLWVGSRAGLDRVSWVERGSPSFETVLTGASVTALALGPRGEIYMGTLNKGLAMVEKGGSVRFYQMEGLGTDEVHSLYLDPEGRLWIGTGGGIALLDGGKLKSWRTTDGLFTGSVNCVVEDGRGRLWISTNRGIFYVEKSVLLAAKGGERIESVPFVRGDGMPVEETNGVSQPAGWRMRDGTIWFPTVAGVAVVDPSRSYEDILPPRLAVDGVSVDGTMTSSGALVVVDPGSRRTTVAFTAISLTDANRVTCRYRLEGFDPEWIEALGRREATYTNLPPGRYRFRLEARILGRPGPTTKAELPIRVVPAFQQTFGFYALCTGLVAALAWGVHRLRVRRLRLRNAALAERNHMAQEVHDNISQIMTGLLLQLDVAGEVLSEEGGGRLEKYLNKARELARQGIEEARRTARGLRAAALDAGGLASALRQSMSSLTDGTSVRIDVREEGTPRSLSADAENELFRIGQEAVTNALRHGGARSIELTVAYEIRGVRLTCGDDGRGIDPTLTTAAGGPGMGLSGMWRRLDERKGTLSVRGRPGGGTLVEAYMPALPKRAERE